MPRLIKIDDVPFPRSCWVIPGLLLAGEFPGAKDQIESQIKLGQLIESGIQVIINLMASDERDHNGNLFKEYEQTVSRIADSKGVFATCLRFSIADLTVPTVREMRAILDTITDSIESRKPVYVHCWGGIGRTGTVIGCFLLKHGLAHPGTVLDVIADLRKNDPAKHRTSPETAPQRQFVKTGFRMKATLPAHEVMDVMSLFSRGYSLLQH
jgi:protein-tyrosine phosphatase